MAITPFGSVDTLLEEEVTIIAEGEPVEETVTVSDNLAEDMSDEELSEISSELLDAFEADLNSRKDYEETIK